MTREEKELALYCLKASSNYHSEVCEECIKYPNCDHTGQDDVAETIIKALEQEPVLDKIRAEIEQIKAIVNEVIINNNRKDLINFVNGLNQSLIIIDKYKEGSETDDLKADEMYMNVYLRGVENTAKEFRIELEREQ